MTTDQETGSLLGRHVTIRGGFEDGLTGVVVANEPHAAEAGANAHFIAARPYRYRVWLDGAHGNPDPWRQTVGGLHPVALDPDPCPYCGPGWCQGTASTANGRDLERFERIHQPARDVVHAWHAAGSPR